MYVERPSEWTDWTSFGNVTTGIHGHIVVLRQDGNFSQTHEDIALGVVYTLNVTLVAQTAGRLQVGGTAVRIEFANANGDCKLGAALGASDGARYVDVPFEDGAMFSTAAQLRCDAVAFYPTRLRALERGTNQYGLGTVNNFSSYTSDGFEVYDVPEPPPDLVAVSPPLLASAALVISAIACGGPHYPKCRIPSEK